MKDCFCIWQPKEEVKTVENDTTDDADTAPSAKQPKSDETEVG